MHKNTIIFITICRVTLKKYMSNNPQRSHLIQQRATQQGQLGYLSAPCGGGSFRTGDAQMSERRDIIL